MKRILHLSDLHFGRINLPALEALRQTVVEQEKGFDLIIVTGDWTQRARVREFDEAAEFIKHLSCPVLSIPGNHDVPLYDLARRFFSPYSRYSKLRPLTLAQHQDEEVSVVGLSTVNPYRPVAGVVRDEDLKRTADHFAHAAPTALKVVACHHPIYDPRSTEWLQPEHRAKGLLELGPDVILSGHAHTQWVQTTELNGRKVLHVSAGTTISNRLREEVNSFHILEIEKRSIVVKTYDLRDEGFLERGLPTEAFEF